MPEGDWTFAADQDSLSEPGQKAILSEPLDEWVPDVDAANRFFDTALEITRGGLLTPLENVWVKEVVIEEETPNSFHVVRIACGIRLREIGLQEDDADQIKGKTVVEFSRDPECMWIRTEEVDREKLNARTIVVVNFLRSPFRMEAHMIDAEGKRSAPNELALILKHNYLDDILQEFTAPKAVMHAISPIDQDICAMSEELDDLFTYDVLFDGLWDINRGIFDSLIARFIGGATSEPVGENTVEVAMPIPRNAMTERFYDKMREPDSDKLITRFLISKDRDAGIIHVERFHGRFTLASTHIRILQDPLRVLIWIISFSGKRRTRRVESRALRLALGEILRKQNSVSIF